MGKKLSEAQGQPGMTVWVRGMKKKHWFSVIGLMLLLLAAGCADAGATSDNDKRGVFYGGVSAGAGRPGPRTRRARAWKPRARHEPPPGARPPPHSFALHRALWGS